MKPHFVFLSLSKINLLVCFAIIALTSSCSKPPVIQTIKIGEQEFNGEDFEVQLNSQIDFEIQAIGGTEGISSLEVRDRSGSSVYIIYFKDFAGAAEANTNFQLKLVDFDLVPQAYMDSISNTVSEPGTVSGMFGIPGLAAGQTRQLDIFVRDISNRNHTESILLKIVE